MITGIRGVVRQLAGNELTLEVGGLFYEIHIPTAILKSFDGKMAKGAALELVTYHYYQTEPSKSTPILIGFSNAVEKDFFEKFITVSGVGPKAAVRALSQPIPDIAQAIDAGDLSFLKSLPGIGQQRAKEIIAKLQGKMGKFGLMQSSGAAQAKEPPSDLKEEAVEVLVQLQYKKDEAGEMIRKAFVRKPTLASVEEILNEVYKQRKRKMTDKKEKQSASGREKIDFERVERERLVTSHSEDVDGVIEISLRPSKIDEFIGQENLKENLKIALGAAKKRKEPAEHILLSGPPGLGKTTLAHIVAHEMGAKIMATSGPAIERAGDLIGILTNLEEGDILFIDEIHRLSKVVEEFVYPAMEDYKIDFIVDKGPYAKTIKFSLKRFTLIGATTRQGLLSSPLRDRFGMSFHLDFYAAEDLMQIVQRSAKLLSIPIDSDAAMELARRSRGTPRIANKLLRRVRDYVEVKSKGAITQALVDKALEGHGIDKMGLDALDRKVLRTLIESYGGGPTGVESLSATLNEEVDTLVDVVEPFLLKSGFLKRTSRGREATSLAFQHLGIQNAKSGGPTLL